MVRFAVGVTGARIGFHTIPRYYDGREAAMRMLRVLRAPGRDVVTLVPGGRYDFLSGSSLATAHVTGVVALGGSVLGGPADAERWRQAVTDPAYPHPWYFPIVLAAYLPIYQLGDTLEELLAPPYRSTLPPLLDGTHDWPLIEAAMPADPIAILRPDFQADFRTNVSNPFRQALRDNNTYSWTPKARVTMPVPAAVSSTLPDVTSLSRPAMSLAKMASSDDSTIDASPSEKTGRASTNARCSI